VSVWAQGKININTTSPRTLLSYVCAWAVPETPLCNDTTGVMQASFLTMLNLGQSMFVGIPIFHSPKQLRTALEGQGDFASFFEQAGIPPIKFLSASGFEQGLSLESKVFSIYASGHVKQGKRETYVRITAVVDFRKAPTVADVASKALAAVNPQNPTPDPTGSGGAAGTSTDDSANAGIQGALVPSTAGRVVYFRVN
jgi:hypothetical protein